jgi:hypothetical protein
MRVSLLWRCLTVIILVGVPAGVEQAAWAQGSDEVDTLKSQAAQLYHEGKYAEATEVTKRGLALVEKNWAPTTPMSVAG